MMNLNVEWYYAVWPWIGLCAAAVLIILLLFTDELRSSSVPRFKDVYWLGWACTAAYLIHNVEEYGIDFHLQFYHFPQTMTEMLGSAPPDVFFAAVNISMFWIVSPLAAMLGKKRPLISTGMAGVLLMNAVSHIIPLVTGIGYTSGALTACIVFLPLSLYVFFTAFGRNGFGKGALVVIILLGVFSHMPLLISLMLYLNDMISIVPLVLLQFVGAFLTLFLWFITERIYTKHRAAE